MSSPSLITTKISFFFESPIARPDAIPKPCPKEPVEASIPGLP
jgi:hypothetical protein